MPSFYSLVRMRDTSPDVPLDVEPEHVKQMEARQQRKAEKRRREREQRLFDLEWARQTRGGERYQFEEGNDGEFLTQDRFLPSPSPLSPQSPPLRGGDAGDEGDRRIFWSSSFDEEDDQKDRIPNPIRPESPFSSPELSSFNLKDLKRQKMSDDDDDDNLPKTQRASWAED